MFRKNNTTLGIALSSSRIKIVEVETRSRLIKVLQYISEPYPQENGSELDAQLKRIIHEKGLTGRKAHLALSSSSIQHKVISLPQMSKKEMRMVLQREAKKEALTSSEEVVFDSAYLGSVEENGVKKNKILLVIAPKNEIYETVSFWREAGVEPQSLISSSLALSNCLTLLNGEKQNTIAFLFLENAKASLAITDQGHLEFSRDFIFSPPKNKGKNVTPLYDIDRTSETKEVDPEYLEKILTEINRSFLYYKHQFRGKTVNKIILGGEGVPLEAICLALKQQLTQEVDIFSPTISLDTTALQECQEELQVQFPHLAVNLGLCITEYKKSINLLPHDTAKEKQVFVHRVTMVTLCALIVLVLFTGYLLLWTSLCTHKKALAAQRVVWNNYAPLVENLTRVEQERKVHRAKALMLHTFTGYQRFWQNTLKSLSVLVPDEMLFHRLEISKREESYHFHIAGEVVAESAASVQTIFNQFYDGMNRCPFFSNLEPPVIKLSPYELTQETSSAVGNGGPQGKWGKHSPPGRETMSKLTFEIRGECRDKKE